MQGERQDPTPTRTKYPNTREKTLRIWERTYPEYRDL